MPQITEPPKLLFNTNTLYFFVFNFWKYQEHYKFLCMYLAVWLDVLSKARMNFGKLWQKDIGMNVY